MVVGVAFQSLPKHLGCRVVRRVLVVQDDAQTVMPRREARPRKHLNNLELEFGRRDHCGSCVRH